MRASIPSRLWIIIVCCALNFSCGQKKQSFQEKTTSKNTNSERICDVQVGNQKECEIPIGHGSYLTVKTQDKNGVLVYLALNLPEGVQVKFKSSYFHLKDLQTGKKYSEKVKAVYEDRLANNPDHFMSVPKKDILDLLRGRAFIGPTSPENTSSYSIFLAYENIKPKQFRLTFPEIEINGRQQRIPSICFDQLISYQSNKSFVVYEDNFKISSLDYPHPLWKNLDGTITEIERNDRFSVVLMSEKPGTQGAGAMGRFFFCCAAFLANHRGFNYYVNSSPVDDRIMIVYLENKNEDPNILTEGKFEKYKLYSEIADIRLFKEMCGTIMSDKSSIKKYVRIKEPDFVYEFGIKKFEVSPYDILEILKIKVCRDGEGMCWKVRNIETGEIGYVVADRMNELHQVYTK